MGCAREGVRGFGFQVSMVGVIGKLVCALALAIGLVPAVAMQNAFAADVEYIGTIITQPLIDEDGYPYFNEDGTIARSEPQIYLTEIRNAPENWVVPETMDVIEETASGEIVHKDIPVTVLDISVWDENSGFEGVKTIDASHVASLAHLACKGMGALETITCEGSSLRSIDLGNNPRLSSVDLSNCFELSQVLLTGCEGLSFESMAPFMSSLDKLSVSDRYDIDHFDASSMPELTELSFTGTSLSSIDVSKNAKLETLYLASNKLESLEIGTIPASVVNLNCTYNLLQDTDALVERFGEEAVLPQNTASFTGLSVIDKHDAAGILVAGSSMRKYFNNTYNPTQQEADGFFQEDQDKAWSVDNFEVSSSDETVVKVEKDVVDSFFEMVGVGAGTATLTFDYRFQGQYGLYEGQQVIDFTVAPNENPVSTLKCESSVQMPLVTKCAITGGPHQVQVWDEIELPVEVIAADPNRVPTGDVHLEVDSSNRDIVEAVPVGSSGEYYVRLSPCDAGSATVTVRSVAYSESRDASYSEPVTISVEVQNVTPKPTMHVKDRVTEWYYTDVYPHAILGTIMTYDEDEDYRLESNAHDEFMWGKYLIDGSETPLLTATSDNPDVIEVTQDDEGYVALQYKALGSANITVEDVWGNKGMCEVVVKDLVAEVKKYRLSKQEITIGKGDTLDLSKFIQVQQPVARIARTLDASSSEQEELIGRPVFKSSNGNILPVSFNENNAASRVLGRNVGDVTVSANILKPGASQGDIFTIDQWDVVNFSTLTVHVVEPEKLATAVEITGVTNEIEMGSQVQLSATVTPKDAANADALEWSTSDKEIAKVDGTGKVTPVACGTAIITATVGSVSDSYEITVVPQTIPAKGIVLSDIRTAMKVGETQEISATIDPVDTTDQVTWSSTDEAVLVVDQSGTIKAVGNGKAVITATAGSVSAKSDSITVSTPVDGVSLDTETLELFVGTDPSRLLARVTPESASDKTVTWSSSDEAVATVDGEGNVTPVAPGTTDVTATTVDGGFSAACTVTVKQSVEGVSLDKHALALVGASSSELKASVSPDNATNKDVTWSSSDETVATVDAQGKVEAVGKGVATVTVSTADGGSTDECIVTVSNPVTSIKLAPMTLSLLKGETAQITATCTAALPGDIDEYALTWASSEESVASARSDGSECTVEALSSGSATIEASVGRGELRAACTVAVSNPLKSVSLSESSKMATVGDAPFILKAIVDPADADDAEVAWSSSNPSVAKVSPSGEVEILGAGAAKIVATVAGKSAACSLDVKEKEVTSTATSSGAYTAKVIVSDAETARKLEEKSEGGLSLEIEGLEAVAVSAQKALDELKASGLTVADVLDIHFANGKGEEIVVNDENGNLVLTVKIKLTEAMKMLDPATIQVIYVADDGSTEEKETWIEGDYLCFKTNHFSTYAVTGRSSSETGAGNGSDSENDDEAIDVPLGKGGLAPTGDPVAYASLAFSLAGVAAGAVLVVARRRAR